MQEYLQAQTNLYNVQQSYRLQQRICRNYVAIFSESTIVKPVCKQSLIQYYTCTHYPCICSPDKQAPKKSRYRWLLKSRLPSSTLSPLYQQQAQKLVIYTHFNVLAMTRQGYDLNPSYMDWHSYPEIYRQIYYRYWNDGTMVNALVVITGRLSTSPSHVTAALQKRQHTRLGMARWCFFRVKQCKTSV